MSDVINYLIAIFVFESDVNRPDTVRVGDAFGGGQLSSRSRCPTLPRRLAPVCLGGPDSPRGATVGICRKGSQLERGERFESFLTKRKPDFTKRCQL